jgi:hypothetical protein
MTLCVTASILLYYYYMTQLTYQQGHALYETRVQDRQRNAKATFHGRDI